MAKGLRELIRKQPPKVDASAPIIEAACRMRAEQVSAVIVEDDGHVCGIVTDRDIAIRGVARGLDTQHMTYLL